jgi:hypothetical protein
MVELLRLLRNRLSDTVAAWDEFRRGEIGYFNDGESTAVLSPLKDSMGAVNKAFSDLKEILRKLRDLERELCEDSPQGVSHFSRTDVDGKDAGKRKRDQFLRSTNQRRDKENRREFE